MGIVTILVSPLDIHGRMIGKISRLWAFIFLKVSGIPYRVSGLEQLDPDKQYFFAANHESALDIPLVFANLPYQLVSIAKKELKKIPILGWAMMRAKHIFIDRHNYQSAKKSLNQAIESMRKHPRSVLVFPEGTRSTDGEIHRLKKGGLGLAVDLGIPIVPVAICGTADILARRSLKLKPGKVELKIGTPVDTTSLSGKNKAELADYLREQVVLLRESWMVNQRKQPQVEME